MKHIVMNCKDWEEDQFVPGSFASFKFDGVRGFFYPDKPYLVSRDNKMLYGFDHIVQPLLNAKWPHVIDMELLIPGYDDWNKMSGQIRNHEQCPDAVGVVLDIPSSPGAFFNRQDLIWEAHRCTPHLNFSGQHLCNTVDKVKALYGAALRKGLEGLVIKTPYHKYRNTRSYDWMRMTPIESVDVIVTRIYEGKGKMEGIAGGFYFMLNGIECKCGTMKGMTYEDREDMWWNQDDYIGRCAEVHFKEYQKSGKPRQPRFKGWRYDK